jgi:DNA-binding protein H-NS
MSAVEYARISAKAAMLKRQISDQRPVHRLPPSPVVYRGPGGEVWDGKGHPPKWLRDLERGGLPREVWRVAP